jgi:hypothetical protein
MGYMPAPIPDFTFLLFVTFDALFVSFALSLFVMAIVTKWRGNWIKKGKL